MRRALPKIAIFVLAFGLGVAVSAGWQLYRWSRVQLEGSPEVVAVPSWSTPTQIMIVGGLDACGRTSSYHTLNLSDGTRILQTCKRFSSPLGAARDLKIRLSNAEIAARSEDLDEQGRVIGETILTSSPNIQRFTLHEKTLCVTSAPSLHHLRLYESHSLSYAPSEPLVTQ